MAQKHVVIVGGGFGGIKAALELCRHDAFKITLISDTTHFRYYPALYRTATGGSRVVSTIPYDEIFAGSDITVVKAKVTTISRSHKRITTENGQTFHYDFAIFGLGVQTNYFGIKGLPEYSFGIKSLEEAEEFKAHLHQQMIDERKPDLHYIIVGGGPTGVELAGALPAYLKDIMKKHGIRDRKLHIDLVEAAPRIMPRMPASVSKAFTARLRRLGIKVYVKKAVQAETTDALLVSGKPIRSHTVIWTAGIAQHPFFKENNFMLAQNGKVQVDKYMQAWPNVFVIGDNADTPFSGMAQTALYDAIFVADNLIRHVEGDRAKQYKPKKPIYVTPAGPYWAACVWGPLHIYGWAGWLLRRAADWLAYRDYEPWWKATARTLADTDTEDNCVLCATVDAAK